MKELLQNFSWEAVWNLPPADLLGFMIMVSFGFIVVVFAFLIIAWPFSKLDEWREHRKVRQHWASLRSQLAHIEPHLPKDL
jgi:hypothetical protein